jgi:hypothetical protein
MARYETQLICRRCGVEFYVSDKILRLLRENTVVWPQCVFGHALTLIRIEHADDGSASARVTSLDDNDEI